MSLWVLDTDTVTLFQRGNPSVQTRLASVPQDEIAIAIVTVEEMLTGWYAQIRRVKTDAKLIEAYDSLREAVEFAAAVRILPLDAQSLQIFKQLRGLKLRIGTNDLRIGAIAIANGGTVVTCNRRDFDRIPGLAVDDWS